MDAFFVLNVALLAIFLLSYYISVILTSFGMIFGNVSHYNQGLSIRNSKYVLKSAD